MRIIRMPNSTHCSSGTMAKLRRTSGSIPKMTPPTIGPASVPLPPVMTMITMVTV
jgi:hypothetical protein